MEALEIYSLPELKELIRQIVKEEMAKQGRKPFMNLEEASKYLGISKNTMYVWTSNKRVPYYKQGKMVYFKMTDLETFALNDKNRKKSHEEFETEFATKLMLKGMRKKRW